MGPPMPSAPVPPVIFSRALHSAKVLTECPIAVVLIFQTYKTVMNTAMLEFYPLVMESIKIQPEPQRLAHEEAEARGDIFVGVASGITNRDMYAELIKAQVKVRNQVVIGSHIADGPDYGFLGLCPTWPTTNQHQGVHGGIPSSLCEAAQGLPARGCWDEKSALHLAKL